ncbi:helix-turn-helix transcriptional regulator [Streptacidiphilus sp. 4-A2]|nr:helix-turn-helix transcriptional regulator [Streptacidiphilus sp. 4-A2]
MWLGTTAPELARVALRAADEGLRAAIARDLARLPRPLSPATEPSVLLAEALTGADLDGIVEAATSAAARAAAVDDALTELAAWEEAAVAAAGLGDKELARKLGRRALERAAQAGADAVTARVVGRLRAAGVRFGSGVGRRRPTAGWESLTPTETQVAHLVAEGLSGPDIARRLHISPRTVQTHVSHALVKLGLGNRLELAAATAARADGAQPR